MFVRADCCVRGDPLRVRAFAVGISMEQRGVRLPLMKELNVGSALHYIRHCAIEELYESEGENGRLQPIIIPDFLRVSASGWQSGRRSVDEPLAAAATTCRCQVFSKLGYDEVESYSSSIVSSLSFNGDGSLKGCGDRSPLSLSRPNV